jgi:hypothetical protein
LRQTIHDLVQPGPNLGRIDTLYASLLWPQQQRQAVERVMRANLRQVLKACCVLWLGLLAVMLVGCEHFRDGAAVRSASVSAKPKPKPRVERASRTSVALPDRALLISSVEPDCEFKTNDPNADERQKLDYERQCYRHAEIIVRDRLGRLQGSVRKTARVIDHCRLSATWPDDLETFDVAER